MNELANLVQGLKVGDQILFDHFGSKDRLGVVVKITATKIHVEWTAPSSGKTRVVPLTIAYKPFTYGGKTIQPVSELIEKNVRLVAQDDDTASEHRAEWRQRLAEREAARKAQDNSDRRRLHGKFAQEAK